MHDFKSPSRSSHFQIENHVSDIDNWDQVRGFSFFSNQILNNSGEVALTMLRKVLKALTAIPH